MELRKKIKQKIKDRCSVNDYADANNIRRASLVDYLNGKKDLTTKVLLRVLKPLNMGITEFTPESMKPITILITSGKTFAKGEKYKGKEIESVWTDEKTDTYAIVLKNKDSKLELLFL